MTTTSQLPIGTVTFFFSDVEGSTGLLQRLADDYRGVIERHAEIIRRSLSVHHGTEVSTEGDSFFAVFTSAGDAVAAAADIQESLAAEPWPPGGTVAVRIGLHTGAGELGMDNYVGIDVNRAARISAAGHGGQIVVSETVRALASGAEYLDLGEHTLKGLDRIEHLYQHDVPGLPQDFPPLRTESTRPNNLPILNSRIVGRQDEVARLTELLGEHRLVTITGPGGVGKTRLAIEVAGDAVLGFERGAFFVDLAPIDDDQLVLPAIAAAVGIAAADNAALVAALQDGPRLLVLDNFEQVITAATVLGSLMEDAAALKVLVTSQVPLRLSAEELFRLEPLASGGDTSPAVELFVARAKQADREFDFNLQRSDVVDLVAALEGIPLAIELAAARMHVLTPGQVRDRLETGYGILKSGPADAPDRHRSLTATVEWSYGLLEPDQQNLLEALSVFRGGAAIDALEHVSDRDPIDNLAELVDRNLVRSEAGTVGKRFRMLAPVHAYVADQATNAAELAARHTDFFSDLAAVAHKALEGDSSPRWLATLSDDHGNVVTMLDRLLEAGDIQRGYDVLGSIWRFFQTTGRLDELDLWLGRFFASDQLTEPTLSTARALVARAALFYWRSKMPEAAADYEAALAIATAADDRPLMAEILAGLSPTRALALSWGETLGDPAEPLTRAHALFAELGDSAGLAEVEFARMAMATIMAPEPVAPDRAVLQRLIDLYRDGGRPIAVAHTQMQMAESQLFQSQYEEAHHSALAAIDTAERAGDVFTMGWALRWLGVTALEFGDPVLGARLAGASAAAVERSGGTILPPMVPVTPALERARALIGEQADEAFEAGKEIGLAEAIGLARELR